MVGPTNNLTPADYAQVLEEYLQTRSEGALYHASVLSQVCIESGLGPEDMVALHFEALEQLLPTFTYRKHPQVISDAHQFLLEIMISYGVKYKEYLELRLTDSMRTVEAQLAREQERAMELDRLQREKSEILAVIAHEMRTPITVVRGNLDLMSRSLSKMTLEPMIPQLLLTAREALGRMSRLTADLVEASRDDLPVLEKSPQDLKNAVAQACDWVRPAAESKGLAFTTTMPEEGVWVLGSADALLSVFGNLLSNAFRYTPAGGWVKVSVGVEGPMAQVTVQDSGIGMTPEVQARVFEKFYRAPDARQLEAKGLGLGLSLVLQLVRAHGGDVTVESEPSQGSTFRVTLPRQASDALPGTDVDAARTVS